MAAYCFANVRVLDAELYEGYRQHALATVQAYGGRYLVRGGHAEAKEGAYAPWRVVLLEFPDLATAQRWYASAGYQAILPLRAQAAETDLIFLDGLAPPATP